MDNKIFYKKLFILVLPIAIQNLMSALVSASDALMLGWLDQESLSAVSLATQVQLNPCKVIRKITEEDRKYYYK
ncbi:MAG: hypothetical protein PUH04_00900, partial [Firmicutes bacterium]|nr:hypothetical protein [Bacillota bacterium]